MTLLQVLEQLRPQMAQAAQSVYNTWEQDAEGYDEVLGSGGICQDIADAIADILPYDTYILSSQCGDQHVWLVAYNDNEGYHIDIPAFEYETGSGYNWTKRPDIIFKPEMIIIEKADSDLLGMIHNEEEIY